MSDEPEAQQGDVIALLGTTTRLFDECLLPNGALIEAPAHLPYYPARGPTALLCRPGVDLPVAILAMDALGRELRTPLLRWLVERAHGFTSDGLLARAYEVHGPALTQKSDLLGTAFLLYVVNHRPEVATSSLEERVTRSLASAVATRWDGRDFPSETVATSAERAAAIAMAEAGLHLAGDRYGIAEWTRLARHLAIARREALADIGLPPEFILGERRDEIVRSLLLLSYPLRHHVDNGRSMLDLAVNAAGSLRPHHLDAHDADRAYVETAVRPWELCWLAAAFAGANQSEEALLYFNVGLSFADEHGHLPASFDLPGRGPSAKPYLLSHLALVVAAAATGELAKIPKSGYTGPRRRIRRT
jgi:hypothetical protein